MRAHTRLSHCKLPILRRIRPDCNGEFGRSGAGPLGRGIWQASRRVPSKDWRAPSDTPRLDGAERTVLRFDSPENGIGLSARWRRFDACQKSAHPMRKRTFRDSCGEFEKANDSSSPNTIDPWLSSSRLGNATPPESELRLFDWRRFRRRTACRACPSAS